MVIVMATNELCTWMIQSIVCYGQFQLTGTLRCNTMNSFYFLIQKKGNKQLSFDGKVFEMLYYWQFGLLDEIESQKVTYDVLT